MSKAHVGRPYDSWPDPIDKNSYPKTKQEARRRGVDYWCPRGGCAGSMGCACTC